MDAQQTHLAAAGDDGLPPRPCDTCGTAFTAKRSWSRFCSTKCRNDFHGEERRREQMRDAAPELYEALVLLHNNLAEYQRINKIGGYDNHDMTLARAALAKAGYKEPKPEKPKAEVAQA